MSPRHKAHQCLSGTLHNDACEKPRILTMTTRVPDFDDVVFASARSDHYLGVMRDGKACSWGYSIAGETGQGTAHNVEEAILINHSSIRGKEDYWGRMWQPLQHTGRGNGRNGEWHPLRKWARKHFAEKNAGFAQRC